MQIAALGLGLLAITASSSTFAETKPSDIELDADAPITATVEGRSLQLSLNTGLIDRLTLNTGFVTANAIKPAAIAGKANVDFWGRKEIEGKNRPVDYTINEVAENGRAFWFYDVPQPRFDGSIGPWAIPFERITVRISLPVGTESRAEMPYFGDLNNGSITSYAEPGFGTAVSLAIERELRYPLASAATGAAIAAAYGGTLSGEEWLETIAFGITRPVRLLTLERPIKIGPFSLSKIAVRTRGSRDAAGSGEAIGEASANNNTDPSEIIVLGRGKKAKRPAFTLAIGRATLNQCASVSFDKAAKKIILYCRPS